jgi:xanthine dehydrogenase YagR molybdenum-binding subunit
VTTTAYIGRPISRVDGAVKVTGSAKYAAEYTVPNLAYGVVVSGTVARGKITRIDAVEAIRLPGVLQVLTHENAPKLPPIDPSDFDPVAAPGSLFVPLQSNEIKFSLQPVALVLADNFELARYAASLVRIEYERAAHTTDFDVARAGAYVPPKSRPVIPPPPEPRGDARQALAHAAVRLEAEYRVPAEHHNPMEPFASTVILEPDGKLTVYDKNQGVQNAQEYVCTLFGLPKTDVRVLTPFMGGGFGSGLHPQYQLVLAVLAARVLKRSVRVTLTRQQMFSHCYRPITWQRVALGSATDGKLEAVVHEAVAGTSSFEDYTEAVVDWSGMLYACDNVTLDYKLAKLDLNTPADMRAPGAAWGLYALECAIDELAVKLRMDPLEFRLKNYADKDGNTGLPYSSKALRDCFRLGAERFGWSSRSPQPRSMRDNDTLIGWGMASAAWEAGHVPASAKAVLSADGKLTVSSATEDIGTGTYTIMAQIAAEEMGIPIENVTFELGDSSLPPAFLEGGSLTAGSVGSAVKSVCGKLRERLFTLAQNVDKSPLAKAAFQDVMFADGQMAMRTDASRAVAFTDAMRGGKLAVIEEQGSTDVSAKQKQYSRNAHSAIFAEVRVDEDLGTIQVTRVVSAAAVGRVLNPKTARSQLLGGVVWGIGMALEEESVIDQTFGRFMNHSFGEYHVPVNADVHDIDVIFVDEPDEIVNALGAKGLGEIGIVGVAAAIANAVFHATGKRIRELPITLDKVL